jgi:alkylation response protein AidB-like acyl-CoA dehydrogenase
MDLEYGPRYDAFRAEVREFLAGAWPPSGADAALPHAEQRKRFIARAIERGYMYRGIPKRFGGSERPLDLLEDTIIAEEFDAADAPWHLGSQGVGMIVPTLLEIGADWQREKFIPPTLTGEFVWCQGYSEPGAGSDLASLRSTARLENGEWVIDGHKIWTSEAQEANYMFGMFRTEPDAPKHAGISYLLLRMDQPGIRVRPLRQLNGAAHFNEVFFDGVRTPADWIVGKRGQGWQVARVNLKYERNLGGGHGMRRKFRELVELARRSTLSGRPALQDATVRQRLAAIEGYVRCVETMAMRRLSASARGEESKTGLATLVGKLYGSQVRDQMVRLAADLLGDGALLAPRPEDQLTMAGSDTNTGWVDQYLFALGGAIAAGSSNIQRNIIAERGLGLPRDARPGAG